MKSIAWLLSFFSVMAVSLGVFAQEDANPLIGKHLFRAYCLVCHGTDGKGKGPIAKKMNLEPADLSSAKYQGMTAGELANIVGTYRRGDQSKMPNWGLVLPRADLLDIAAYISNLTNKDILFIGDSRRGRVTYKNACVACHGQFGKGKGLLAHLFQISMLDFSRSSEMDRMSDERLIQIIREGMGDFMPPWRDILSDGEITDVAAYVRMLSR